MRQYTGILCVSAALALALYVPESLIRNMCALFGAW